MRRDLVSILVGHPALLQSRRGCLGEGINVRRRSFALARTLRVGIAAFVLVHLRKFFFHLVKNHFTLAYNFSFRGVCFKIKVHVIQIIHRFCWCQYSCFSILIRLRFAL